MTTGEITVEFQKKDFNDIYLPYLQNTDRFLVFYGGRGSGKSVFIAQRYIYKCISSPYFRLLFCRKVARTVRNSQFQLFKDLITRAKLTDIFIIREGNMEIECVNGNKMIAGGMDDTEKIKSIQELTDVWCEEATEFTRDDIVNLNLVLRTKKAPNQIVLSFNPISKANQLYDSLFVKKEYPATILKTTYLDNRFLPPAYAKEMERLKEINYNLYLYSALGEWGGMMEGLIYPEYKTCEAIPGSCEIIYGLDFGFNHPTALVKVGLHERDIYVQQILYQKELTNSELINRMKNLYIGKEPIYCDSEDPNRIEELYHAGFNVHHAEKGKDSVASGINLIKSHNLYLTDDSTDLIKEIQTYVWAKDKEGRMMDKPVPVKFMDDGMDAMRYPVFTHLTDKPQKLRIVFT